MSVEQTLSIIKPDGVQKNLIGEIYSRFEKAGLRIIAARMMHLSKDQAEDFYAVHRERSFFRDLVNYMTSGPVMVQVLEGEAAVETNRRIMGATNPADADPGTIRAEFANSIEENIVHGSDGADTAAQEIAFFFGNEGICPRTRGATAT
jgi:nucleoside-diphosphate kinase